MAESEFTEGQEVFLKAGHMMRDLSDPDDREDIDFKVAQRGEKITLTAAEAERWDAGLIFAATEEDLGGPEAAAEAPEAEEDGEEDIAGKLASLNVEDAKAYLSTDDWTEDDLTAALEAEEEGKNRSSVTSFIEERLEAMSS